MNATLKASPAARTALDRAKLSSRLTAVVRRAEVLPQLNLGGLLAGARNRLDLLQFTACADLLDDVDSRIERHMESLKDAEMAAAGQAQDQLLADRGTETFEVGTVRSRDGWVWLKTRKPPRLSSAQSDTGDKFAALWRAASRDTLSTASNDNGAESKVDSVDALRAAREKLGAVSRHIEHATGSERLFDLLANVCGRGETLRALAGGDDRKAGSMEADLRTALDMAGVAFKVVVKRVAP